MRKLLVEQTQHTRKVQRSLGNRATNSTIDKYYNRFYYTAPYL
jgi:hypothetical protein